MKKLRSMKRMRIRVAVLLIAALVIGSLGFTYAAPAANEPGQTQAASTSAASAANESGQAQAASTSAAATPTTPATPELDDIVTLLGDNIDGERAFDFLSYVFLGWRTTGGHWQNQIVANFIPNQLTVAGYNFAGKGPAATATTIGAMDKSYTVDAYKARPTGDDDYAWVTYYPSSSNVWDPEYAKLEVVSAPPVVGRNQLIDRINVESYSFDPTSQAYKDYYADQYGVSGINGMWNWVTAKTKDGVRKNVVNGEEAKLGKRTSLASQTSFTEPKGTDPKNAKGMTGAAVYVGTVTGTTANRTCSEIPADQLSTLAGKVLLSDSSLSSTTQLAKQFGAIAVMSTSSLSDYNLPTSGGSIIAPFDKSARYASGTGLANSLANMNAGKPIVEWQFTVDQKAALKELLQKAGSQPVIIKNVSIGDIYPMNDASKGGVGQAVAIAEVKGASKPDERILICAHVQEPGSNDNATGVGALMELATRYKTMIDAGTIPRPARTITFLWGDEMTMATLWQDSHPDQKAKLVAALDMDMVGEDPAKTGGVMRIEKTPDPSATYDYTLDILPEQEPYYDETFKNSDGDFIRLPDSHTLWGAGSTNGLFRTGYYLNDLYMAAAQSVIANVDSTFRVDVCPYEGGSDHSRFLSQNVPALLTWHFTDFTYHSSVDTLAMSSAVEMQNVNITTLSTAYMMANADSNNETLAKEILKIVFDAAKERFAIEAVNTEHHLIYAEENNKNYITELAQEKEVLNAWAIWYEQALQSIAPALVKTTPSADYRKLEAQAIADLRAIVDESIAYAEDVVREHTTVTFDSAGGTAVGPVRVASGGAVGTLPVPTRAGYDFDGWYLDGQIVTPAKIVSSPLTLTAHWAGPIRVEVRFDTAGGNPLNPIKVVRDGAVGVLPVPTHATLDFDGWYLNGQRVAAETVISQNVTLVARWKTQTVVQTPNISLASAVVASIKDQIYTGKAKTPDPAVTLSGKTLAKGIDYTLAYRNNKEIGKAEVTVSGTGSYEGAKTVTFKILPKKVAVTTISAKKKAFTLRWKKSSGITNYQARYKQQKSTSWKTVTVSANKAALTVKKLKSGKTYSVQIRSFKAVATEKYYGAWSKTKTIKIK